LPRQSLNDKALEELACYDEYHKSIALLGYTADVSTDPPDPPRIRGPRPGLDRV